MDEALIAGRGGFQTRAELMREAVENLLTELDFPEAHPEPRAGESTVSSGTDSGFTARHDVLTLAAVEPAAPDDVPAWEREELLVRDLAGTALRTPPRPELLANGTAAVPDEPLLGLHNRDFVSLWALQRLARYTTDGLIDFGVYLQQVTRAAWFYGGQLQMLEAAGMGQKLTVLLPTNTTKRPSAERGFQSFAIGSIPRSRGDAPEVHASGPLFAWSVIDVLNEPGYPTGVTAAGWQLLQDMDGISLAMPHHPDLMSRFMAFLQQHAPSDRWGFDHTMKLIADGPSRQELVDSFADSHPRWSSATASSVAQGYVARAREWGLVESRLVEGRYWLTDLGRQFVQGIN